MTLRWACLHRHLSSPPPYFQPLLDSSGRCVDSPRWVSQPPPDPCPKWTLFCHTSFRKSRQVSQNLGAKASCGYHVEEKDANLGSWSSLGKNNTFPEAKPPGELFWVGWHRTGRVSRPFLKQSLSRDQPWRTGEVAVLGDELGGGEPRKAEQTRAF